MKDNCALDNDLASWFVFGVPSYVSKATRLNCSDGY